MIRVTIKQPGMPAVVRHVAGPATLQGIVEAVESVRSEFAHISKVSIKAEVV